MIRVVKRCHLSSLYADCIYVGRKRECMCLALIVSVVPGAVGILFLSALNYCRWTYSTPWSKSDRSAVDSEWNIKLKSSPPTPSLTMRQHMVWFVFLITQTRLIRPTSKPTDVKWAVHLIFTWAWYFIFDVAWNHDNLLSSGDRIELNFLITRWLIKWSSSVPQEQFMSN